MKISIRLTALVAAAATLFCTGIPATAQSTQVQGVINGRNGATMTLQQVGAPNVTVLLTDTTSVGEMEGVFKGRTKQMPMTALIPGLPVQVTGVYDGTGTQIIADQVKFKGDDLKNAMDAQAGLQPTVNQVNANTAQIQQTQEQMDAAKAALAAQQAALAAQEAQLSAEQQKINANKAAIAAANKRFGELGEYNILGEATVYFANGETKVESQYTTQLLALAAQAKTITAYIIQVQGYASAVGSVALNQKLSSERANAVTEILQQQGQIPLTNMLAPGAMGTSSQVDSDATVEGQAQNRRVVVRILQNKGVSGT